MIHRAQCIHDYNTSDEVFELEDITCVFGLRNGRWFQVISVGHEKEDWEREHLLVRDDCTDSIRNFWSRTGLDPTQDFYKDVTGKDRCTVCDKTYSRVHDLKAHKN